jgi:UPF0716 protein FxsA
VLGLLLVLFIVVPIAELAIIIQVGEAIGVLPTIALLILDSILGSMLMRSQGRRAWLRFNEALRAGRAPAREVLDGALILFGGALLLTPGFISDLFGAALLLPPSRAVIRRIAGRRLLQRMTVSMTTATTGRRTTTSRTADYEGTAVDVEPREIERP